MFKLITSTLLGLGGFYGMFYIIDYIEHNYHAFWVLPTELITVTVYAFFCLLLSGWNLKG